MVEQGSHKPLVVGSIPALQFMLHLHSLRSNVYYAKLKTKPGEEPQYERMHELVFLCQEPKYAFTSAGDVAKSMNIEELRFVVPQSEFKNFIDALTQIGEFKDEDLV